MPNHDGGVTSGLVDLPYVPQSADFTCGAACFDSMYRYFKGASPGEMHFAKELGTLDLGYTPPDNVVALARRYGFACEMSEGASVNELLRALRRGQVVFVTWWYEDAGHYSLVKGFESGEIVLMDPWVPRPSPDSINTRMPLEDFIPHWKTRGSRLIVVGPNQVTEPATG